MGRNVALLAEADIPAFVAELGKTVAASGKSYDEWIAENPQGVEILAVKYKL